MISEVFNMDCMDYMAKFPDKHFSLAIVDPPYNIGKKGMRGAGKHKNKAINRFSTEFDNVAPPREYFTELFRVSRNQIIWGGNYFSLPPTRGILIWDKKQAFPNFSAFEYAWTSFNKPAKIYTQSTTGTGEVKIHSTQKSVKLYEWLLHHYAQKGDTILDTHIGSGSSRIACYNMGFDFYGTELDANYFNSMEKRYKEKIAQQRLFEPEFISKKEKDRV